MDWLGLDVGGANLKMANGRGWAVSRHFPLWQQPLGLARAIAQLLAEAPAAEGLALSMTGELADCFETKREGVARIIDAVLAAAATRQVRVYLTDGSFCEAAQARDTPLLAAAANWHALATFAGRFARSGAALLIDIGSTTTDLIPLHDGVPRPKGLTDPDRLLAGELVYTGVQRSPVCALVADFPWRGVRCPVAQELFATTWDVYLILGELPEEPASTNTADGRPATKTAARDRLAHMICADRELFSEHDALAAAGEIREAQLRLLETAAGRVMQRPREPPHTILLSGSGEFLGRELCRRLQVTQGTISLAEQIGPSMSRCATAHALAVLAQETIGYVTYT